MTMSRPRFETRTWLGPGWTRMEPADLLDWVSRYAITKKSKIEALTQVFLIDCRGKIRPKFGELPHPK